MEIQYTRLTLQVYNFSYKIAKLSILDQVFNIESGQTLNKMFFPVANIDVVATITDPYAFNHQSQFFFINPHMIEDRIYMNYRCATAYLAGQYFAPQFNYWSGKGSSMSTAKGTVLNPLAVQSLRLMPEFKGTNDFILSV